MKSYKENDLKCWLKHKIKITIGTLVLFCITGNLSFADKVFLTSSPGAEPILLEEKNATHNLVQLQFTPDGSTAHQRPKGLIVRGNSNSTIHNLDVDVTFKGELNGDQGFADSNASYGVAVGYDFLGGNPNDLSKLTVDNMNIKLTNTPNTVRGFKQVSKSFIMAKVNFGHQLSGLKIYRKNGALPEFVANKNVTIKVSDSSLTKIGDYLVGLYISGDGSKATFNGKSRIDVEANGKNSAAIKIGKPIEFAGQGSSVIFNDSLVTDTSKTKESANIRLFSDNSKLEINGEETSYILSGNSAIVFDTQDYITDGTGGALFLQIPFSTSRNANGKNQSVILNNTEIFSNSENSSLIKVKADYVNDVSFGQASALSHGQLTSGFFSIKNATFQLQGEKSLAIAPKNGWLIEVQEAKNDNTIASSELHSFITKKAHVIGQMLKQGQSKLEVVISDNAIWELKSKEDEMDQRSLVTNLTLQKQGILDAGKNISTTPGPEEHSDFKIKLSSDSIQSDNTLNNNGGIITLANERYNDILTIDGNYAGQNGTLKINTLWNSPGDMNGQNSKSDLLKILGTASGETNIVSVGIDEEENIIDGTIGSIESDLHTNSVPVVQVENTQGGNKNAFVGTAKTTGAGQLQIAEREIEKNGKKIREYYWTITSTNPKEKKDIPILIEEASGYVQMPKVNMEMSYASLRTLHERKGEDRILDWETFSPRKKMDGQVWVRFLGNKNDSYGRNRFSLHSNTKGAQFGQEFSLKQNENGTRILKGAYLTIQETRTRFEDKYRSKNGMILKDKYAGHGRSHAFSLGLTRTSYTTNQKYLDLVGQISFLNNQYHGRNHINTNNHAFNIALSTEIGKMYTLSENLEKNTNWIVEPQAQLIFQYLHMSHFKDSYRDIHQNNQTALRGRLGLRFSHNDNNADLNNRNAVNTIYGITNIWHDFIPFKGTHIGSDYLKESYSRTLAEIGIGVQIPIGEQSYLYADMRYARNLEKEYYREYRGSVGFKYTFD